MLQVDPKNIPTLEYKGKRLGFREFIRLDNTTPDSVFSALRSDIANVDTLATSLSQLGEMLESRMTDVNVEAFDNGIASLFAVATDGPLAALIENCTVVADISLTIRGVDKKMTDRYCPICGQQAFKNPNGGKAVIQQRETFFPIAVKSHTNSGSGAESEGSRIMCQYCAFEPGTTWNELECGGIQEQAECTVHPLIAILFVPN